jgi:hypothetical protein
VVEAGEVVALVERELAEEEVMVVVVVAWCHLSPRPSLPGPGQR